MRKIILFRFEVNPRPNPRLAEALAPHYSRESTVQGSPFGVLSCLYTDRTVEELQQIINECNCGCPCMVMEVPEGTCENPKPERQEGRTPFGGLFGALMSSLLSGGPIPGGIMIQVEHREGEEGGEQRESSEDQAEASVSPEQRLDFLLDKIHRNGGNRSVLTASELEELERLTRG